MTPFEIDSRIRTAIEYCLVAICHDPETSSIEDHILDSLDDDADEVDLSVLGNLSRAVAYSPDGSSAWLLVPHRNWRWDSRANNGELLAISDRGECLLCNADDIRSDRRFWAKQGAQFSADDLPSLGALQLVFDGDDWAGTQVDSAFGESDWVLTFNGEEDGFDLSACRLGFASDERVPSGTWLEIVTDGYSMSTGDIGVTISVDVDGGLFVSNWGYIDAFWGLARPDDVTPEQLLHFADPESCGFTSVGLISSDHLTKEEMQRIVPTILSNGSEDDDVEITCADWSGSLDEFMGRSGSDADDNDAEADADEADISAAENNRE